MIQVLLINTLLSLFLCLKLLRINIFFIIILKELKNITKIHCLIKSRYIINFFSIRKIIQPLVEFFFRFTSFSSISRPGYQRVLCVLVLVFTYPVSSNWGNDLWVNRRPSEVVQSPCLA